MLKASYFRATKEKRNLDVKRLKRWGELILK